MLEPACKACEPRHRRQGRRGGRGAPQPSLLQFAVPPLVLGNQIVEQRPSRLAANGLIAIRCESSISYSPVSERSQVWLTPKLNTTSSRVILALAKLA